MYFPATTTKRVSVGRAYHSGQRRARNGMNELPGDFIRLCADDHAYPMSMWIRVAGLSHRRH